MPFYPPIACDFQTFSDKTACGCSQKFLHDELKAKDIAEEHLKSSGLPYSIVRPGGLLDGTEPPTGTGILVAGDPTVSGSICRADLAALTLQCMMSPALHDTVCSALDKAKARGPEIAPDSVVSESYGGLRAALLRLSGPAAAASAEQAEAEPLVPGKTGDHDTDSAERPAFTLLSENTEANYQVRQYPSLIVAETTMSPEARANESGRGDPNPFMTLAGFIGVLSTPANHAPASEEPVPIAMTSPVLSPSDSTKMSFVMPSEFTMETMPVPTDPAVTVTELPPRVYAVTSFSGWAQEDEMQSKAKELRATLETNGVGMYIKTNETGEPVWLQARYDSPWVPAEKARAQTIQQLRQWYLGLFSDRLLFGCRGRMKC